MTRQPGSNTIQVIDQIRALLPFFNAQIPPSAHLIIRGDRGQNIREAFQDIQFTMAATLGLVILVIFLFLRNLSATMIPGHGAAFFDPGHVLGDVPAEFQHEQHLDDGA